MKRRSWLRLDVMALSVVAVLKEQPLLLVSLVGTVENLLALAGEALAW